MTKKDKAVLIDGLKKLSQDIADIAAVLEGADTAPAKKQEAPAPEQEQEQTAEPTKTVTYEEVRAILAEKSRTGFRAEVKALLTAHGADKLSAITDPEELAAIAKEAEVIGSA
jgi:hypothetical protein